MKATPSSIARDIRPIRCVTMAGGLTLPPVLALRVTAAAERATAITLPELRALHSVARPEVVIVGLIRIKWGGALNKRKTPSGFQPSSRLNGLNEERNHFHFISIWWGDWGSFSGVASPSVGGRTASSARVRRRSDECASRGGSPSTAPLRT